MSPGPGPGATAGTTAGVLGLAWTRELREGTGEMWRFSENENKQHHTSTHCIPVPFQSFLVPMLHHFDPRGEKSVFFFLIQFNFSHKLSNRKQRHMWDRRKEAKDGGLHLRFLLCMSLREEGGEGAGEEGGLRSRTVGGALTVSQGNYTPAT